MKKIFLLAALVATVFSQSLLAQDTKSRLNTLLSSYYDIKNDLVKSNSADAAAHSGEFLKAINNIDKKAIPAADMAAFMPLQEKLAFDARHISESKDIADQREHFASFSVNVFKLAKTVELTDQAVYYAYCPMKKSYWLSAESAIKNPYYGSQMLTCGRVAETLKK